MDSPTISNPARVLMVDDEAQQVELRASILRMAGFSVLSAPGPMQALSLVTTVARIDIAIVDYDMPTMNGGVLAQHLKAKFPKLNIVLYSGAIAIPSQHLRSVNAFISKAEGVVALLHYLRRLSTQIAKTGSSAGAISGSNPESPPSAAGAPRSLIPAVFAAANVS